MLRVTFVAGHKLCKFSTKLKKKKIYIYINMKAMQSASSNKGKWSHAAAGCPPCGRGQLACVLFHRHKREKYALYFLFCNLFSFFFSVVKHTEI